MTPLERVTAALEARGHHVKHGTARCPAHNDTTPSLSVSEGADGKALVKCHAGCTSRQIVEALNLAFTDLFPAREADSVVVARYPYTDADGNVVVTVIRTHPKGFYRDPKGVVDVPLYNLPKVKRAIEDGLDIWVVEGEKDVHTLERHGETATCNIGGAGKFTLNNALTLDFAQTIYIVADRDDAGRAHAKAIHDDLEGVIPNLSIWEPAVGKDISDHFAAGLTISDLQPFHDNRNSPESETPGQAWIAWDGLWAENFPDEEWVIEPLIPRGRGVSLYAPAKEGKSTILLAAAAAAATGQPIFGLPAQPPIRAVYGDYEMTRADLKARLQELGYGPHTDLSNLYYYLIPPWAPLDTVEGGVMITAAALTHQADVVFVDTIGRAVAGDENDADTLRAWYRCTGQTLKREGIAWLRADHSGKDLKKGARGTSAKNDDVDIQWFLKRSQNGITITRTHTRINWAPEKIVLQKREDETTGIVTYEITHERGYGPGTKELAELLDDLGLPISAGRGKARTTLINAGHTAANTTLEDALRWRKTARGQVLDPFFGQKPTPPRAAPQNTTSNGAGSPTGSHGQVPAATAGRSAPLEGGSRPAEPPNQPPEELF